MMCEVSDMSKKHDGYKVTILGSGTCVPSLRRSSCAVLMEIGDVRLVFDIGPGTLRRLLEAGVIVQDVDYLFLSHFHPDHSGELVPFIFANKYPDGAARTKPLRLITGCGGMAFFDGLKTVYGRWIDLPPAILEQLEMRVDASDRRDFPLFSVETAPMVHNSESVAYRVTTAGGFSVVYSGDTDYTETLVRLARGADLLICETAFPDGQKIAGHLTPSLAGEIAAAAGVAKLVMTHFYPDCETADVVAQCRRTYDGPLVSAEDLMVVAQSH